MTMYRYRDTTYDKRHTRIGSFSAPARGYDADRYFIEADSQTQNGGARIEFDEATAAKIARGFQKRIRDNRAARKAAAE